MRQAVFCNPFTCGGSSPHRAPNPPATPDTAGRAAGPLGTTLAVASVAELRRRGLVPHVYGDSVTRLMLICQDPTRSSRSPSGDVEHAGDVWRSATDNTCGAAVTAPPAPAAALQYLVWLHETPQAFPIEPAGSPSSNAARTCRRRPNGIRRPAHVNDGMPRRRQRAARNSCYWLRWPGSAVLIGAWLEAPLVVIDRASSNTRRHGGRAAPVHERLTVFCGHGH